MKIKFLLVIFCVTLAVFPLARVEAEGATFISNDAPTSNIYPDSIDNLVFDLTVTSPQADDALNALVINNRGTANTAIIQTFVLWADAGTAGFQGFDIDTRLGEFTNLSAQNSWYITDLDVAIPTNGLHLFISLETKRNVTTTLTRSIQLRIQLLGDANANGSYDINDYGIFLASGNNGPAENITNTSTQNIIMNTIDRTAPQVLITAPENFAHPNSSFTVTGKAQDQGGSVIGSLQIKVGDEDTWHDTTNLGSYYYDWEYNVVDLAPGFHHIYTLAKDNLGNSSGEDYQISVTIDEPVVETPQEPEEPEVPEEPDATTTILYKYSDSSTVYLIDNVNMLRRPIFNATIFDQYNYDWSAIETVSSNILASYTLSEPVLYTTSTLLKFSTDPYIYLVKNGNQLEFIPDEQTFIEAGYEWTNVKELSDSYLAQYVML